MMLYTIAALCSCSKNQQSEDETEQVKTYYIPPSYYKIARVEPKIDVDAIKSKGKDYYTDVYVKDGGMEIKLTEGQREKTLILFAQNFEKNKDKILKKNSTFKIEQSADYMSLTFITDEHIVEFEFTPYVMLLITGNIYQQILHTGSSDWSTHVKFVNGHTGKTVIEGDLPKDPFSFGEKEWKESYN